MGHEYIITLVSPNIKYNTNITSNISRYIRLAWAPQWTPLIKNRGSAGGLKTAQPRVPLPDPWLAMTDCRPAKWPGIIPISCRGFCTWLLNLPPPPDIPRPRNTDHPRPRTTNSQLLLSGKIWSILVILSKINTFCSIHWSICVGGFNWGRAWTRISGWTEGGGGVVRGWGRLGGVKGILLKLYWKFCE